MELLHNDMKHQNGIKLKKMTKKRLEQSERPRAFEKIGSEREWVPLSKLKTTAAEVNWDITGSRPLIKRHTENIVQLCLENAINWNVFSNLWATRCQESGTFELWGGNHKVEALKTYLRILREEYDNGNDNENENEEQKRQNWFPCTNGLLRLTDGECEVRINVIHDTDVQKARQCSFARLLNTIESAVEKPSEYVLWNQYVLEIGEQCPWKGSKLAMVKKLRKIKDVWQAVVRVLIEMDEFESERLGILLRRWTYGFKAGVGKVLSEEEETTIFVIACLLASYKETTKADIQNDSKVVWRNFVTKLRPVDKNLDEMFLQMYESREEPFEELLNSAVLTYSSDDRVLANEIPSDDDGQADSDTASEDQPPKGTKRKKTICPETRRSERSALSASKNKAESVNSDATTKIPRASGASNCKETESEPVVIDLTNEESLLDVIKEHEENTQITVTVKQVNQLVSRITN